MGLYNAVFGYNEHADELLAILGCTPQFFNRFRDAFVTEGKIAIYTRLGGPNREDYKKTIEEIREHPLYDHDTDDSFDSTYCTFYFRIPEEVKERISSYDIGPFDPDLRWKNAIERANQDTKEAERVLGQLGKYVKVVAIPVKRDAE